MQKLRRFDVIIRLKEMAKSRVDIANLAAEVGVTIVKNGKLNKGWVGQTLDRLANTQALSASQPDGIDFELKSVHFVLKNEEWVPKETLAITMFNPETILAEAFEDSALWHKLARMILVGHSYTEGHRGGALVRFVMPIDVSDPTLRNEIERYWRHIRTVVQDGKIATYSSKGTSSGFIQLRTKGSGTSKSRCPLTGTLFNTRAFYATKRFIKYHCGTLA